MSEIRSHCEIEKEDYTDTSKTRVRKNTVMAATTAVSLIADSAPDRTTKRSKRRPWKNTKRTR